MPGKSQISRLVGEHPLFAGLNEETSRRIGSAASRVRLPPAHILFRQADLPDHLYVLTSGTVEFCAPARNGETCLAIACKGDVFMLAPVVAEQPYLVTARTSSQVVLMKIDATEFRKAASQDLELSRRTSLLLASKFRSLQRMLIDERMRTAPQRLAALLIRTVENQGANGFVDVPVPRRTLAARLGISAESVSRALRELEQHGLRIRGRRAFLADRDSLEKFCSMDPLIDVPDKHMPTYTL